MTDNLKPVQPTAAAISRNVQIKGALLAGIAAFGVLVFLLIKNYESIWWAMPAGILFGAALGVLNFRWLAFAVERALARKAALPKPLGPFTTLVNGLKLIAIFLVLFVVIKWELVNVLGLILGLSVGFLAILWEGLIILSRGVWDEK